MTNAKEYLEFLIKDPNVLNIYKFGSQVYGTARPDSDTDYVVITKDTDVSLHFDFQFYTKDEFQRFINNEDIKALECFFLPKELRPKQDYHFMHTLDKGKLRVSISTIANGSYVKGKKKLTVLNDYDKLLAIKSLFHSLRILDFGIQIAELGSIVEYGRTNWLWREIYKLSEQYDHNELWDVLEARYKTVFNNMSTEFKKLCPKMLIERHTKKDELIKLFTEKGFYTKEIQDSKLIIRILEIFDN